MNEILFSKERDGEREREEKKKKKERREAYLQDLKE